MSDAVVYALRTSSTTDLTRDAWRIHLTFSGFNDKNKSGVSDKWWQLDHQPGMNFVELSFGATGRKGQTQVIAVWETAMKLGAKIKSGYRPNMSGSYYTKVKPYHTTCNRLMEKLVTMGAPYDQTIDVQIGSFGAKCVDKDGDVILTIAPQGVKDLLGVWSIP